MSHDSQGLQATTPRGDSIRPPTAPNDSTLNKGATLFLPDSASWRHWRHWRQPPGGPGPKFSYKFLVSVKMVVKLLLVSRQRTIVTNEPTLSADRILSAAPCLGYILGAARDCGRIIRRHCHVGIYTLLRYSR